MWGNNPSYTDGALVALHSARIYYPDWEYWFYINNDVSDHIIQKLENCGGVVIRKQRKALNAKSDSKNEFEPTFWRFLPISDPAVDVVIARDTDSVISEREALAVHQWLNSGKDFHIMRDHPMHEYPILAGMWGCKAEAFRDMASLVDKWDELDYYGCDQKFLGTVIYPRALKSALIHTDFIRFPNEQVQPFPNPAVLGKFVGMSLTSTSRTIREIAIRDESIKSLRTLQSRPNPWSLTGRARHLWLGIYRRILSYTYIQFH